MAAARSWEPVSARRACRRRWRRTDGSPPLRVRGGAAVREVGIEFGALPAAEMMVHDQALARCVDRHGEPAAPLGEADQPQVGVQDLRLVDDQHRQRPGFLDLAGDLRPDGTAGGGAGAFGRQVEFPGDRLVPVHDVAGDHRDGEHPVQAEMPHRPGRMLGLDQQLGGRRQPLRLAAVGARLGVPDIEAAGALAMQPVAHGPAATRVRPCRGCGRRSARPGSRRGAAAASRSPPAAPAGPSARGGAARAHGAGQCDVVVAHLVGGLHQTRRLLGVHDHRFQFPERSGSRAAKQSAAG